MNAVWRATNKRASSLETEQKRLPAIRAWPSAGKGCRALEARQCLPISACLSVLAYHYHGTSCSFLVSAAVQEPDLAAQVAAVYTFGEPRVGDSLFR